MTKEDKEILFGRMRLALAGLVSAKLVSEASADVAFSELCYFESDFVDDDVPFPSLEEGLRVAKKYLTCKQIKERFDIIE
jgi:hypothetical protein